MDFFGFGSVADLNTPLGFLIKAATDALLPGPDWSKNLDICDVVNGAKEGPDQAMRALMRRLQDANPKIVYLALILAETCMKNCPSFAAAINVTFMEEMVGLSRGNKGSKNAEESLRLIQQWGRAFESKRAQLPIFFDTFVGLKARGIQFPPEEVGNQAAFEISSSTPPPPVQSRAPAQAASHPAPVSAPQVVETNTREFQKLEQDLGNVMEKVRLCREMLQESPGISKDEALAEVVGFLEACRDRMVDVIEAGTHGLLSEDLFAKCLRVNDSLLRTLEAEKTGEKLSLDDETSADSGKAAAGSAPTGGTDDLLDLGADPGAVISDKPKPAVRAAVMEEDDDDDFGSLTLKTVRSPAPPAAAPAPAVIKATATIKPLPPPPSSSSGAGLKQAGGTGGIAGSSGDVDLLDLGVDTLMTTSPASVVSLAPAEPAASVAVAAAATVTAPNPHVVSAAAAAAPSSSSSSASSVSAPANDLDLFFDSVSSAAAAAVKEATVEAGRGPSVPAAVAPAVDAPTPAATAPVPVPAPTPAPAADDDFDSFLNSLAPSK